MTQAKDKNNVISLNQFKANNLHTVHEQKLLKVQQAFNEAFPMASKTKKSAKKGKKKPKRS